jgi:hypothetical protein
LNWEEVEQALKKKNARLLVFEAPQVVDRFEKMGDLFEPVLELKQKLPTIKELSPSLAGSGKQAAEPKLAVVQPDGARPQARKRTGKSPAGPRKRKV